MEAVELAERYRPASWAELVGHDRARRRVETLRARGGLAGRAYWISGASGTGKTSIAYLIAHEVAAGPNVVELDAGALTAAALRHIEDTQCLCGLFGGAGKRGRAYLVDEAHGLKPTAIRQLLVMLERLPRHVVWVFTSTKPVAAAKTVSLFECGENDKALLSRCHVLPMNGRGLAPLFAARARQIAVKEGLDGKDEAAYVELVRQHRLNMRAVLFEIESGAMLDGGPAGPEEE